MTFVDPNALTDFASMKINFELGGGLYVFKKAKHNGFRRHMVFLYTGVGGKVGLREEVKHAYQ